MTRVPDATRRCVPVAQWPDLDRAAWAIARAPSDPFEPAVGYASRWKPTTILNIEGGYGRWLGWLAVEGELDPDQPPGDRATRNRVSRYLGMLQAQGLAPNSVAGRLQQLGNALKAMAPDADWSWILKGSTRLYATAVPVKEITARTRPPEEVERLGLDLMHAADHDRFRTDCDRATLFRDGLLIALLIRRPLRLANLAAIEIDRQLHTRGECWWLAFDPSEMKSGRPLECCWPADRAEALERYMRVHRPVLLKEAVKAGQSINALWIAKRGTAMGAAAIEHQVADRTGSEFGTPINPHTFRHIAATAIATADPENTTSIMSILGHAKLTTSEKYYNRAEMVSASDRYQAAVMARRHR